MIALHGQTVVGFDCDQTLILWHASPEQIEKSGVLFTCPTSKVLVNGELQDSPPWPIMLVPHKVHIEQLKKHKSRHTIVVVWSAAGSEWAETVVKTLGLEQYVDLCIGKFTWLYDDLKLEEFMPQPIWMKDE